MCRFVLMVMVAAICTPFIAFSQFITAGPIVGGVTSEAARIYIMTDSARVFVLELDTSMAFANPISINGQTDTTDFLKTIVNVSDLQPSTKYYYRFMFNGVADTLQGSFKSFPEAGERGYYKILVGSCNYNVNSPLFQSIKNFEPDLFLHLGDWNWPPAQFGDSYCLYPDKVAASFAARYRDDNMRKFILPFTPVDYIYDDDYTYNDSEGWTYPNDYITTDSLGRTVTVFVTNNLPPGISRGAIKGYSENFPGYDLIDSAHGIYHKMALGNVDIFMLDARTHRTPKFEAFSYDADSNRWSFHPDSNHTMIGKEQRDWLINGLLTSDADWKLVSSGIVFNKRYRFYIDVGMAIQNLVFTYAGRTGTGATLSSSLAYNWAAYPADQDTLIKLYQTKQVQDLVMLTGDSHSTAIDDGTNAGIPELNASGLAANDEGYAYYYIDSVSQAFGFPSLKTSMWNGGGNGIDNRNFSDSYGTVEIFGNDSIRLCAKDEMDQTMGCITMRHSSKTSGMDTYYSRPEYLIRLLYPNPAKDRLEILLSDSHILKKADRCTLTDVNGRVIQSFRSDDFNGKSLIIPVKDFAPGTYIITFESGNKKESRQFIRVP
ncbi:MAG: alkaline phosphatase D family protein [Chitinophagales bacterium]|nr:alkaline phosphatase D family protein [Chitinophagales bacterium]